MDENKYIDYYCEHLLVTCYLDENTAFYDNDIRTIDFNHALHNAKMCGITEKAFKNAFKSYKHIVDVDALWKFSIIVWMWKSFYPILMPDLGAVDQYLQLINSLNQGLDVKDITISGRLPNQSKDTIISLTDDCLIGKLLCFLYSEDFRSLILTEQNIHNYSKTHFHFAKNLIPKRTRAFQIAREITKLFEHLFKVEKLDDTLKNVVMTVLVQFKLAKVASNNTDYNKLFSDAKRGRIPICDDYYSQGVGILPFSIVKNPDSIKERQKYGESAKE